MKVKQSLAVMAFVAAILCESQTIHAQSWNLTGNSNAATSSKLGTTNAKPLRLTTNNQTRVYIDETVGNVGIGSSNFTNPNYRLYVGSNILDSSSGAVWGDGSKYGVTGTGIYGVYGAGDYGVYGN